MTTDRGSPTLEDAIRLALEAHAGQRDRAGAPAILHALRVMMRMGSEVEMTAAVLHDVVEDSEITVEDLRGHGYPDEVVDAVDRVSHRPDEPYEEFIERAAGTQLSRAIKLADLEDNVHTIATGDHEAQDDAARYRAAIARLAEAAPRA